MLQTIGSARSGELFSEIAPWLAVLLGVVIIGTIVIFWLKRSLDTSGDSMDQGFILDDLRRMHREGELSDEEFERAKMAMIGRLRSPKADSATSESTAGPAGTTENPSAAPDNDENPLPPPG